VFTNHNFESFHIYCSLGEVFVGFFSFPLLSFPSLLFVRPSSPATKLLASLERDLVFSSLDILLNTLYYSSWPIWRSPYAEVRRMVPSTTFPCTLLQSVSISHCTSLLVADDYKVIVFFASIGGCGFPVVAKKVKWMKIPPKIFFFCKHFGTGVLIATAFVHVSTFNNMEGISLTSIASSYRLRIA